MAEPQQAYEQAVQLAAAGNDRDAVAMLQGAAAVLPQAQKLWRDRMLVAARLLAMRRDRRMDVALPADAVESELAAHYLKNHPAPAPARRWHIGLAATLLPGAGHALLGRWHDAVVAALLVWPMIGLTLWAAYRRMGPVTVFFAGITVWLWSGSVFSAMSLAERGALEDYLAWWQGLWQAAGLPGRPW